MDWRQLAQDLVLLAAAVGAVSALTALVWRRILRPVVDEFREWRARTEALTALVADELRENAGRSLKDQVVQQRRDIGTLLAWQTGHEDRHEQHEAADAARAAQLARQLAEIRACVDHR